MYSHKVIDKTFFLSEGEIILSIKSTITNNKPNMFNVALILALKILSSKSQTIGFLLWLSFVAKKRARA